MHPIALEIRKKIIEQSNPKKAEWWEKYMKQIIPFRGVGIPELRKVIKDVLDKNMLKTLDLKEQEGMLTDLVRQSNTEEKLAAVLYMQLF